MLLVTLITWLKIYYLFMNEYYFNKSKKKIYIIALEEEKEIRSYFYLKKK